MSERLPMGVATRYRVPGMCTTKKHKRPKSTKAKAPVFPGPSKAVSKRVGYEQCGFKQCLLREWNSSPPIVVAIAIIAASIVIVAAAVIIVAAITAVGAEAVDVAEESQLLLNLRPLGREPAVIPT